MRSKTDNLDYIASVLHGRHGRMAEGARLEALSRLRTLPELAHEALPNHKSESALDMQCEWTRRFVEEVMDLASYMTRKWAALLQWLAMRCVVENLKSTLRGFTSESQEDGARRHHIPVPRDFEMDLAGLEDAQSLEEFIRLMSRGPRWQVKTAELMTDPLHRFLLESALDHGYFLELMQRAEGLGGEEGRHARDLVSQTVDSFHLMLAARGHLTYRLERSLLSPMHVMGSRISRLRFRAMLASPDAGFLASLVLGRAIDVLPHKAEKGEDARQTSALAALEACAWNRSWRLAQRAFRHSHMGEGAVVGFVELRRIEIANLITLSEGIRMRTGEDAIRSRFVPRSEGEVLHV